MTNLPPPPPPPGPPGPPSSPPPGEWPPQQPYQASPQQQWAPPPSGGYDAGFGAPAASFFLRFAAYFIDGLVQGILFIPAVVMLFAGPSEVNIRDCPDTGEYFPGQQCLYDDPTSGTWLIAALLGLVGFVLVLLYRAKTEGRTGQTIGKKAFGIKTVDISTGEPIGSGRAIGRYFSYILSGFLCNLGFLWALWDPQKQAWHDKIVSTRVVSVR